MSTINDFGIPGIAQGILHPKHKHRWRVRFVNIAGGTNSTALSHQLTTFDRPKIQFDKIELHRFNSRAFVAGKHMFEPVTFVIEDDISGTASRVIQQQVQTQQWLTGAEGPFLGAATEGSQYKFGAIMEMMDGGRDGEVAERISFEGCFFENVDYDNLDYSSSDAVLITSTMSFDHFRQDLGGYSGPGSALGGNSV